MNTRSYRILFYLLLALLIPVGARAVTLGDQNISVTADVTAASKYIWRGYNLVDDWTLQPSLTFAFGSSGTTFNIWGSRAFDDDYKTANEVDFTLSHSVSFTQEFAMNLGMIGYYYPEIDAPGADATTEIFLGASYACLLNPTATLYYDFDEGDGAYLSMGLSYAYKIIEELTAKPSLTAGYNFGQFDKDSGFNDVTPKIAIEYAFGGCAYLTGAYAYVFNCDDEINPDDESVFTISLGATI